MRCRACGGITDPVFEMEPMPLAGGFTRSRDEALAAERYPLTWARCRACGLVNVEPDIADEILYRTYGYASSTVPALVRHHAELARFLARRVGHRMVRVLDIGCNDGVLLKQLPVGWERVGVDPSDVAREAATDYGLVPLPFSSELARALGSFHLIIASNAFAHFSGIGDAFAGVAAALRPGGEFWIEVHDLEATLDTGQWDTIYHEHKVEWSEATLRVVAAMHGLGCISSVRLPLHGGLLRLGFRRSMTPGIMEPEPFDFRPLQRAYDQRRAPDFPLGSVAYGAAGRATVYLNQARPAVDTVFDASPRRIGRFVPGVGLPILAAEDFELSDPPAALITSWNHAADIKARHPRYQRWVTAW